MKLKDVIRDFDYLKNNGFLRIGRNISASHAGLDIILPIGCVIIAPVNCKIIKIFSNHPKTGNALELYSKSLDVTFRLLHLSHIFSTSYLNSNQKKGAVLALTGNTGRSTAPHLHLEILKGQGYKSFSSNRDLFYDPLTFDKHVNSSTSKDLKLKDLKF